MFSSGEFELNQFLLFPGKRIIKSLVVVPKRSFVRNEEGEPGSNKYGIGKPLSFFPFGVQKAHQRAVPAFHYSISFHQYLLRVV